MKSWISDASRCFSLLFAVCLAGSSAAAPALPAAGSLAAFDRTVVDIASTCRSAPSTECVDSAWAAADADGDGRLSPDELRDLRNDLDAWATWKRDRLPSHAGSAIQGGLRLVEVIGVGPLLGALDADRDGLLTREEALSDIRLDNRPIARVLTDEKSLDRESLSRRLAGVSPFLAALVRSAPLRRP